MIRKRFSLSFGLILVFGLCIAMLSRVSAVSAGENEPRLNVSSVSVVLDETFRLRVYNLVDGQTVSYRSSDSSVARVSQTGKVKGLSCGSAVITATVKEGRNAVATLQCEVLIGPAAVSIRLTTSTLVLQVGKSKLLTTIVYPLNTVEEAKFFSTAPEVARVSAAGRVRAVTEGATTVYALLLNGTYDVCEVTVLSEEDYARLQNGESLEEILKPAEETGEKTPAENSNDGNGEITPTPVDNGSGSSTESESQTETRNDQTQSLGIDQVAGDTVSTGLSD